jgi:hypothetical protein
VEEKVRAFELAREGAGILVSCAFLLGLLKGFGLTLVAVQVVLVAGVVLGALAIWLAYARRLGCLLAMLILVPLLTLVCYGLSYGLVWYFVSYLPSTGEPLFSLGS